MVYMSSRSRSTVKSVYVAALLCALWRHLYDVARFADPSVHAPSVC
jgi:hypothetical protein